MWEAQLRHQQKAAGQVDTTPREYKVQVETLYTPPSTHRKGQVHHTTGEGRQSETWHGMRSDVYTGPRGDWRYPGMTAETRSDWTHDAMIHTDLSKAS